MGVNKDLNEVQVSLTGLLLPSTLMGYELELLNNGNEKSITYYNKVLYVRGTGADLTLWFCALLHLWGLFFAYKTTGGLTSVDSQKHKPGSDKRHFKMLGSQTYLTHIMFNELVNNIT